MCRVVINRIIGKLVALYEAVYIRINKFSSILKLVRAYFRCKIIVI